MNDFNSFSSIDSLMQFGMGLAVANQMVNMMNHTMASMQVPGAGAPLKENKETGEYYVLVNQAVAGPFSDKELETLVKAKTLTQNTLVWKQGMSGWTQGKNVPEVQKVILLNS